MMKKHHDQDLTGNSRDPLVCQLEERLRIASEQLRATTKQLEHSNERFQTANEELLSVNEKLQSTNEELETSREELQALNEELVAVNGELHGKMEQLTQASADMENLLASSGIATLFFDRQLAIRGFTPAAAAIFNLIPADIGRPFRHFAGNVDWPTFSRDAGIVLAGEPFAEREVATLDRERCYLKRMVPYRATGGGIDGVVVTFIDISQRKRIEDALRSSEEQQRLFIEHAPAALAMFDLDMRYLSVSRRWRGDYHLGERDLVGVSHYEVFPEISKEWRELHRRGLAGEVLREEADRFPRADGSLQWVRWEIRPWYGSWGEIGGIVIFTEDITDIKLAQDRLRDSEERFRTMVNAMPQLSWIAHPDGFIFWYNQRWYDYTGTSPEQMEGWGWQRVHDPRVLPDVLEKWRASIATGDPFEMDFPLLGADGRFRRFLTRVLPLKDAQGSIVQWFGTNTDVTELKEAEEALHRYELLAGNSRDIILFMRRDDGRVLDANFAALAAYGYRHEELLELGLRDLREGYDEELAKAQLEQADAGGILFETMHRRKDGSSFPVEVSSRGATIGGTRMLLSVVRDISDRKRAEKATGEADEQRRLALEAAALGSWDYNFETGEVHWDERCRDMWGIPQGHRFEYSAAIDRIHAEDREATDRAVKLALSGENGGNYHREFRVIWPDGSRHWIASHGRVYFEGEGGRPVRFVGVNREVSEEKRSEEALARLAAIVESSGDAIISKDLNGVVLNWNAAAERLFGYRAKEACGCSITMLIPPELLDEESHILRTLSSGERIEHYETVRLAKDGRRISVSMTVSPIRDAEGRIIGISKVARDITERKRGEEQLKELTKRLSYHIDNSPLAVIEWGPDMRLTRWSGAAKRIFGWSAQEVLGKALGELRWIGEPDERQGAGMVSGPRDGVDPRRLSANRNYRKDGSVVYCEWYNSSLLDAAGNLSSILSLGLDVTVCMELEASLQQHAELLESRVAERTAQLREKDRLLLQQSRLAAMGEMINNIAHQWRQPLNVLGLNIQRLSLFYELGGFDKEFLDTSTRDAMQLIRHMSQTIDDFRNFFKPDKEKVEFNVNQAIRQTINLVADSFQHHQLAVFFECEGEAWVSGYPNEFSQAILNLLQNARDALVERKVTGGAATVATSLENGRTVITIEDNAGGIPEEIVGRVFEPYFSTKGLQGTGIGLFMTKNIIETNMGGSITVRNTALGAAFRIEVPNGAGTQVV
jgi:PAS domain S-box-containing protein